MRLSLLVFLLFCWVTALARPPELTSDSIFVEKLQSAIDSVYNLKFNAARTILYSQQGFNENPLSSLWIAYEKWWSILIDMDNQELDEDYFRSLDRSLEHAQKWLEEYPNHLDALISAALAHAFIGRQHANRGDWFGSIKNARSALQYLKLIEEKVPEHPDLLFSKGMINFYLVLVPEKYPLTKMITWALPQGDRELGLAQIDSAGRFGIFLKNEARYFSGTIRLNYEDKPKEAQNFIMGLLHSFPENGYYYRLMSRVWERTGSFSKADSLADIGLSKFTGTSHMERATREGLNFTRAIYHYRKKDIDAAQSFALRTVELSQGLPSFPTRKRYTQASYLLGRIAEMEGDRDIARHWYRESDKSGADPETQKKARKARRRL
jgi:tetratricopeptide (TPR) repeat protein